jgi:hypothetical protein
MHVKSGEDEVVRPGASVLVTLLRIYGGSCMQLHRSLLFYLRRCSYSES